MNLKNEKRDGTWVPVDSLPNCDLCDRTASYDAKTSAGPWGNLCEAHYRQYGIGLGTSRGQRLVLREKEAK